MFIVYSLALGVRLTDRLGTFLELFGDRQVTGPLATSASMDGGLTLLLTDIAHAGRLRRQRTAGADRRSVRRYGAQLSIAALGC